MDAVAGQERNLVRARHRAPLFSAFETRLDPEAIGEFRRLVGLIVSTLPVEALYADVSASAESVVQPALAPDDFREIAEATWHALGERGLSETEAETWMSSADPFRSRWEETARVLQALRRRTGRIVTDLDKLKAAMSGVLGSELPTQQGIREWIGLLRRSFPAVTDEEANELALRFEEVHGVRMRTAPPSGHGIRAMAGGCACRTGALLLGPLPQAVDKQGLLRTCTCHAGRRDRPDTRIP